jgi:hypothetical protein
MHSFVDKKNYSCGKWVLQIGNDMRYCFTSWNASSASLVQTKGLDFRSSLKNGRAHTANLEINRLSAAKHLVSF